MSIKILLIVSISILCVSPINASHCSDPKIDCNTHGSCIIVNGTGMYCKCDTNYITKNCKQGECCHKLKARMSVFLQSVFLGTTGAPYFYIGESYLGKIMLGFFIVSIIGLSVGYIVVNLSSNNKLVNITMVIGIISCVIMTMLIIWNLCQIIQILNESGPFSTDNVGDW